MTSAMETPGFAVHLLLDDFGAEQVFFSISAIKAGVTPRILIERQAGDLGLRADQDMLSPCSP
ncbi:MAG: hypothetical protein U0992_09620 [Planctomycetaceae bacterium]